MKKKLQMTMFIALCLALAGISYSHTAKAAQISPIKGNETITAVLEDKEEVWYSYTASAHGYFTYSLKHADISEDGLYTVSLRNEDGKELTSKYGKSVDSYVWSCSPGDSYYLVVKHYISAVGTTYELTVNEVADRNWEDGKNHSQQAATEMTLNQKYGGILSGNEEDWFMTTIDEKGKFYVELSHMDISETGVYLIDVYLEDGSKIYESHSSKIVGMNIGYAPGTTIYVKVKSYANAYYQPYYLTVHFEKDFHYEAESNDAAYEADPINLGEKFQGMIDTFVDKYDFYSFKLANASAVTVTFGPSDISNTGTWRVSLVDSNGTTLKLFDTKTTESASFYLDKGKYYIRIENYASAGNALYDLKVSGKKAPELKAPKIASVITGTRSTLGGDKTTFEGIKLSKKTNGTSYYECTVSKAKKMTKSNVLLSWGAYCDGKVVGKCTSGDLTKVKGKQYYVQVRPYLPDAFGGRIYGKKSSVVKTKIKY